MTLAAVEYVNIHGEKIVMGATGKRKAKPAAVKGDKFSRGMVLTGFSPEQLAEAQSRVEKEIAAAVKHNAGVKLGEKRMTVPPPFDADTYMRQAKPTKMKQRFHVESAAELAAEMLKRQGWLCVHIQHDR